MTQKKVMEPEKLVEMTVGARLGRIRMVTSEQGYLYTPNGRLKIGPLDCFSVRGESGQTPIKYGK